MATKKSTPSVGDGKKFDVVIETWFRELIHGTPVARETAVYNLMHEAKEDLKRRLKSL